MKYVLAQEEEGVCFGRCKQHAECGLPVSAALSIVYFGVIGEQHL